MIELIRNDIDSFFEVPFKVYPRDFLHVSLFKDDLKRFLSTKNPLFKSESDFAFYTAYRNGRLAGRICTHWHQASNEKYGWKKAYFGYFDCADDLEIAQALLEKAEDFAREKKCTEIIGNFNLTAMQQIGVVTEIKMPYHYSDQVYSPLHVAELLEKCGYSKTFPMTTHEVDVEKLNPELLLGEKQKQIFQDPEYTVMDLKNVDLKEIIEVMRACLNGGFSENPLFVPLTKEEIEFQAKDLMLVVDRDISVIVKHKGQPVGTVVCIPNLNVFLKKTKSRLNWNTLYEFIKFKLKRDSAIIIYYSVLKDYHSKGINGVMLYHLMKSLKRKGYSKMGGTWIADVNTASLRQAEKLNGKTMHKLHLYKKDIE